jgi:hypothetical protein
MPGVTELQGATPMFKRSTRRGFIIGAAIATAMATGGAAIASIPDSTTGVITGCYDSGSGALRVTDTTTGSPPACRSTDKQLPWNQRGPVAPAGLRGPAGPEGPPGPNLTYWIRLNASGGTIASSGSNVYGGLWDTGGYYIGVSGGPDLTKCATQVTPVRGYSDFPAEASVYYVGTYYSMVQIKTIRKDAWPLTYDRTNTDVMLIIDCAHA